MSSNSVTTLIVGAGYVGSELARHLDNNGLTYLALVATHASLARLQHLQTARLDLDQEEAINVGKLIKDDNFQVVYLVPPHAKSENDYRLTRFLTGLNVLPTRFVYISTSGVYGDQKGGITTEDTALSPKTSRAKLRVNAEQQVLTFCSHKNISSTILRVPGIYGPGRLPLEALKLKRNFIQLDEAYPGNRIHRDDLVNCIIAACHDRSEGIYNVGDGNHMSGTEFALEVAKLAGLNPPPQITRAAMKTDASVRRWSFLSESRKLDNTKLLALLGKLELPLRYTNPIDGIRHSLNDT